MRRTSRCLAIPGIGIVGGGVQHSLDLEWCQFWVFAEDERGVSSDHWGTLRRMRVDQLIRKFSLCDEAFWSTARTEYTVRTKSIDDAPETDNKEVLDEQNTVEKVSPDTTADAPATDAGLISTDPTVLLGGYIASSQVTLTTMTRC
jgi:hypothetical protein